LSTADWMIVGPIKPMRKSSRRRVCCPSATEQRRSPSSYPCQCCPQRVEAPGDHVV
jgi:hypothetical protein